MKMFLLFLFIFGFALEIALGRWVYLGLYLLSGVASHLLWWALDPVWVTGVGASGAISGLMGMYIGVYGLRKINFFYWLIFVFGTVRWPALAILPVWLANELLLIGVVDGGGLINLRAGPGLDYAVLLGVDSGAEVLILGRSEGADWLQIRTAGGALGWMAAVYVRTAQAAGSYPVVGVSP